MFNVEIRPGDGGVVKGSGVFGLVVTKEANNVLIKLPYENHPRSPDARATIGNVSAALASKALH